MRKRSANYRLTPDRNEKEEKMTEKEAGHVREKRKKVEGAIPTEFKKIRTYLTITRRTLIRQTSLRQQILARKLSI